MLLALFVFHECMHFSISLDNKILTVDANNENITKDDIIKSGPCEKYEKIILKEGIICIQEYTFQPCTQLVTVQIPSSVRNINDYVFYGCPKVLYLEFPDSDVDFTIQSFFNTPNLKSVTFGTKSNFVLHGSIFQLCNKLEKILVRRGNPLFKSSDDNKFLLTTTNKLIAAVGAFNELVIPSDVVEICNGAFSERTNLIKLTFAPNSKFTRTNGSCIRYTNIVEIEFPHGTEYLGKSTLEYNFNLKKVTFPSTLKYVDNMVMNNNPYIESIIIINATTNAVKYTSNGCVYNQNDVYIWIPKTLAVFTIDKPLYEGTLQSAHGLKKVIQKHQSYQVDSDLVIQIVQGYQTVVACPGGLEKAIIPSYVSRINDAAFSMTNVQEVYMNGSNIFLIRDRAFGSCRFIKKVVFSSTLQIISSTAFFNTTFYGASLIFPQSLSLLSIKAFAYSNITAVNFSACKALEFGVNTFIDAHNLETVILPSSFTVIPEGTFSGCYSLKSITFSKNLVKISMNAFLSCISLKSLILDSKLPLKLIENSAFYGSGLERVSLPDSLEECFQGAFAGSPNLTEISFGAGLRKIYGGIISGTKLTKVKFGKELEEIQATGLSQCYSLTSIEVDPENPTFRTTGDGILYNINTSVLVVCPGGLTEVTINGNVREFASSAFYGCSLLKSIAFDTSTLEKIGESSFFGCSSLARIQIPGSVSSIENSAFYGCSGLSVVVIEDNSRLGKFGSGAFSGCSNLSSIVFEGSSVLTTVEGTAFTGCSLLENFTFVESLKTIGEGAFKDCVRLKSADLRSIETIKEEAFSGCLSLRRVLLSGQLSELGKDSFRGCTNLASVDYCGTDSKFADIPAFTDINPTVSVRIGYPSVTKFCKLPIHAVLDEDCLRGTVAFTTHTGCSLPSIGITAALCSDGN